MNQSLDAVILPPQSAHVASVIWLHGLGADGHDFEPIVPALDLGRDHGIKFIFPHAPLRPITINGGMVMRGWYDVRAPDLTRQEDEAGIEESNDIMERYIEKEIDSGIPSERILLAGFSQGGAVALYCGLRYPKPLAGILALSTYLPLQQRLSKEMSDANKKTPIFMAHGSVDPLIPLHQGETANRQLRDAGYEIEWHTYPIPHAVSPDEISDIGVWIADRFME